jgi:nicotinamide mononucleotide adenylyltransferase
MRYEIIPIDLLKPLELVFPTHLNNLESMINSDGFVLKAIIADRKTGAILDGSHRYVYFLKNGFNEVPVHWTDYDDEDVRVGTSLSHRFLIDEDSGISKEECRRRALAGDLFPPRTTRHFFTFRKSDISLPLTQLDRGIPREVSHLVADVDISEEIAHNKKYIAEINEEFDVIINYLEETSQTKRYLLKQIAFMDSSREVAFFPGKFHPPHMGQIQTILKLIPKYREVIIGVSEDLPSTNVITTPEEIMSTLTALFEPFDNVRVEKFSGVLVKKKDTTGLPEFDVLISGNPEVLAWAAKNGVKHKLIHRSYGDKCSGTAVREALNAE